ncbi:DUF6766 family protein [Sinorhizobium sp. NFACC03]|uniref:DUF6766 family protein n=1 Tax=Sinorhizobium sp. NFACC03 TaxID=1566295 RepID=UPI00088A09A6|nr:DUF6766 family protein [Sinorhizobium sp. NFACC03]SDA92896.1 hypothetical protein SAMN03159448_04874 [Sinorhizobium sp. NFACC03]
MRFFRDNGLSVVLIALSLFTIAGMLLTGLYAYGRELTDHGSGDLGLVAYAKTGHFLSALFENWESEFLQMSAYVMLTAFLFQRGSAESKNPDEPPEQEEDPALKHGDPEAPWPVHLGGFAKWLYSYSLGIALGLLFLSTFVLHLCYSSQAENAEALLHGQPTVSIAEHLASASFWFESFQNWQSEFLSTAVIVILSIFLRFRGSPESKPVAAPHGQTGA